MFIRLGLAVGIHEAGHLSAARLLGIPLRQGRGGACGIRLTFDFSHAGYGREAAVHFAGPLAGWLAAALSAGSDRAFAGMNAALAFLNLLPLGGFDGGGIARCFFLSGFGPVRGERAASVLSGAVRGMIWLAAVRLALLPEPDAGLLLFALGELSRGLFTG